MRVDDFGGDTGGTPPSTSASTARTSLGTRLSCWVGKDTTIKVTVAHGGENVVELEAAPGPAEQTLQNNRAVVTVSPACATACACCWSPASRMPASASGAIC